MSIDIAGTVTATIDSDRWPALAQVPDGPLKLSGLIADRLLRRAAARLPVRLVYPDGVVVGAAPSVAGVAARWWWFGAHRQVNGA